MCVGGTVGGDGGVGKGGNTVGGGGDSTVCNGGKARSPPPSFRPSLPHPYPHPYAHSTPQPPAYTPTHPHPHIHPHTADIYMHIPPGAFGAASGGGTVGGDVRCAISPSQARCKTERVATPKSFVLYRFRWSFIREDT